MRRGRGEEKGGERARLGVGGEGRERVREREGERGERGERE